MAATAVNIQVEVKATPEVEYTSMAVLVVDRSGSMYPVRDDVIGGINGFLNTQKEAGDDLLFSLVTFSDKIETAVRVAPISQAPVFSRDNYHPTGGTALFDAIDHAVKETEYGLIAMNKPNLPVTLVIVTDGDENSSREHCGPEGLTYIRHLLQRKQEQGWTVVYLSADANGFNAGVSLGIPKNNTMQYNMNDTFSTFGVMSAAYVSQRRNIRSGASGSDVDYLTRVTP